MAGLDRVLYALSCLFGLSFVDSLNGKFASFRRSFAPHHFGWERGVRLRVFIPDDNGETTRSNTCYNCSSPVGRFSKTCRYCGVPVVSTPLVVLVLVGTMVVIMTVFLLQLCMKGR
ncbi:hypothetical protein ES707_08446 [subsurface metagenome]